jgi:hypothetical protein
MNWRRLAWLVILLLIVTISWAAIELKEIHKRIASVGGADDISEQLASLQEQIADQRERVVIFEDLALWPSGSDPMPWLTQQADDTNVQLIGVEHLPAEQALDYQNISINITVRGDYSPLGRFINRLEHSPNTLRINSLRIRYKEYTPDYLVMDLSLSYLQKMGEPS